MMTVAFVRAGSGPRPQADDKTCFVCHDDPELKSAAGSSLYVKPAAFAASVHGQAGRGCLACHSDLTGVEDFPHVANLEAVECARCHADYARMTAGGVHGTASPKLAVKPVLCKDCHGYHEVLPSSDPRSPVHVSNRPATCGRCHEGAGANFARGRVHEHASDGAANPARRRQGPLQGPDRGHGRVLSRLRCRRSPAGPEGPLSAPAVDPLVLVPDDEIFVRMNLAERWQHGLLAASFIVLILTGLPVLSGEVGLIRLVTGRAAAYTVRGLLHRAAALVLIGDFAWHLALHGLHPAGAAELPGQAAPVARRPGRPGRLPARFAQAGVRPLQLRREVRILVPPLGLDGHDPHGLLHVGSGPVPEALPALAPPGLRRHPRLRGHPGLHGHPDLAHVHGPPQSRGLSHEPDLARRPYDRGGAPAVPPARAPAHPRVAGTGLPGAPGPRPRELGPRDRPPFRRPPPEPSAAFRGDDIRPSKGVS